MTLTNGRGWINMATKPLQGYRLNKEGALVKKAPKMAAGQKRNKQMQAAREEKAWKAKSTSTTGTDAGGKAISAKSRRAAR